MIMNIDNDKEKDQKIKDSRTHAIISMSIEVHREMGPGFLKNIKMKNESYKIFYRLHRSIKEKSE